MEVAQTKLEAETWVTDKSDLASSHSEYRFPFKRHGVGTIVKTDAINAVSLDTRNTS